MRNKVIAKTDGNLEILARTSDLINDVRCIDQLCWDCRNAYPSTCQKIADIHKLLIDEYDFINTGYQIFDKKGEMTHFAVVECSNFEQGEVHRYTKNMSRIKRK